MRLARYQARLCDGLSLGAGLRILLPLLPVEPDNYGPRIVLSLDVGLHDSRDADEDADRTGTIDPRTNLEWFRVSIIFPPYDFNTRPGGDPPGSDSMHAGGAGAGFAVRGPTWRWERFYLASLEVETFLRSNNLFALFLGPRLGVPFFLDADARHELDVDLGIGLGWAAYYEMSDYDYPSHAGGAGLILSPSVSYSCSVDRRVLVGAGLQLVIPALTAGGFDGLLIATALSFHVAYR